MSINYAAALSECDNKGKVGTPEFFDDEKTLIKKSKELAEIIKSSKIITVHTGAGISTSCGIPDFRGPKGVWTLEKEGKSPECEVNFEKAIPSYTHKFLVELEKLGYVDFLVSQNVDGLHIRSGFPRQKIAEVHGNMFVQKCVKCGRETVMNEITPTLGLKETGKICQRKVKGFNCEGKLHDTVLDWDDALPAYKFELSEKICKMSNLSLTIGTSLQIMPASSLPSVTKSHGGKVVIINLQKTKYDKIADLKINGYCDEVMKMVAEHLQIRIPSNNDVVKIVERSKHLLPTSQNYSLKRTTKRKVVKTEESKEIKKEKKEEIESKK